MIIFLLLLGYSPFVNPYSWDTKVHNINNVEFTITNYGIWGNYAYWPRGSTQNYIFGAGIWIGAIDSIFNDTLVTIGYGPHGGECEFAPGLHTQNPYKPYVIIYMYPDPWPAPPYIFPMAPQSVLSNQDSWCCYNDCDSNYHVPNDTRPIGIEVYQTGYAWVDTLIDDALFLTFEIKNVLHCPIKNLYFGIVADCDIGNEAGGNANDICSAILKKWYVIDGESIWVDNLAYQWQNEPEPGWTPGVIGFDMLQTPFDLQWNQDKDNDGIPDQYERDSIYYWHNVPPSKWDSDNDGVPDWRDPSENPQLEMTAFKRFTLSLEPNRDSERYLSLAGYNYQTGQYEPYDTVIPLPEDQRFLLASGPFELLPDSSVTMVLGVVFANWMGLYQTPDTAVVLANKWMQKFYDRNWHMTAIKEAKLISVNENFLSITPNPATNFLKINYTIKKPGRVTIKMYNVLGQLIKTILNDYRNSGNYSFDLDTRNMVSGTYIVVMQDSEARMVKMFHIIRE